MWTGVKVKGSAWGILGVSNSAEQMAKQQVAADVPTHEALVPKAHFGIEFSHEICPFYVRTYHPISPGLGKLCILLALCYRHQKVMCDSSKISWL